MDTYTISFVTQDPMQVYCKDACTGKCYMAETQVNDNSAVEIMQEGTCYKIFLDSYGILGIPLETLKINRNHINQKDTGILRKA